MKVVHQISIPRISKGSHKSGPNPELMKQKWDSSEKMIMFFIKPTLKLHGENKVEGYSLVPLRSAATTTMTGTIIKKKCSF
ncbi:hypothetical protein CHARACLAT_032545 [Characodon lateralis]|uniref:Uncharacterized protein n=1 Tax=Characodon lateralis TaxID=208331 RepID=A0ABU7EPB4_9TELE|nr:hypothetical protein [Characodon lateralis]